MAEVELDISDIEKFFKEIQSSIDECSAACQTGWNAFHATEEACKEPGHNKILGWLLDPPPGKGGVIGFRHEFYEVISKLSEKKQLDVSFVGGRAPITVDVEKKLQDGQPDLVLYGVPKEGGKKEVVLVESKINGAKDQHRQLPRYLESLKEAKCDVKAIVYLAPDGPDSAPDESGWEEEEKQNIKRLLVTLPVYAANGEESYLSFLKKCVEKRSLGREIEELGRWFEFVCQYYEYLDSKWGNGCRMKKNELRREVAGSECAESLVRLYNLISVEGVSISNALISAGLEIKAGEEKSIGENIKVNASNNWDDGNAFVVDAVVAQPSYRNTCYDLKAIIWPDAIGILYYHKLGEKNKMIRSILGLVKNSLSFLVENGGILEGDGVSPYWESREGYFQAYYQFSYVSADEDGPRLKDRTDLIWKGYVKLARAAHKEFNSDW